ncbi:hypothetical protein [Streptacidiphilus sp. P02-A3a]|uniref:hypothetical protein n=1 Tax=Streptacidiphilus sp. P02-A3a TaxID=2704468 RepID=UPI0015FDED0E|nr:hypothetical protein [Streptacidiphilus sp. P02-A3a]QMU68455.1 hypothetical protein GXP74_09650 [Streptacidiphilus sp. P02-A3a]
MDDRYVALPKLPLSPPGIALATLRPLADALNALGFPVADVLDDVTTGMVELAFNSLTPTERQRLLGTLGIKLAAPRRAGTALCRDLLSRLQRDARQRRCHCSARALTHRVILDIGAAANFSAVTEGVDPVARWGETLGRLAILAWCNASAADARVLVWAAERDWLGYAAEPQLLDAVREAADQVIEASPGFTPYNPPDQPLPDPHEFTESAAPGSAKEADVEAVAAADAPPQHDALDLEHAHQALEAAFQAAREAARRIGTALEGGYPPAERDTRALTSLTGVVHQVRDCLAAAGVPDAPEQLAALAESVRSHLDGRRRDRTVRAALRELLTVTCAEGSPATAGLAAAQELARAWSDTPHWDDTGWAEATALGALVELVRLREQPDPPMALAEIMSRQQQVGITLPTCSAAALLYKELSLPGPDATTAPPPAPAPPPPPAPAPAPAPAVQPKAEAEPVPPPGAGTPSEATPTTADHGDEGPVTERAAEADPRPVSVPAVEPAAPAAVPAADSAQVVSTMARLIAERRFGLAFHLARAAERPESEQAALRLAAAGAVLASGAAGSPQAFVKALQYCEAVGTEALENHELLALPALLRASLATGEYAAGAQLKALAGRLPNGLATLAIAVADPTLSSALAFTKPLSGTADVSESENRLRELVQHARDLLKPPRLRFNRATTIAKRWLAPDGLLGSVLHALVEDVPEAKTRAQEAVDRLSRLTDIHSEIDRMDRELRGSSSRTLQGSGRQDLVHLVERTTDCTKSWIDVTEAIKRGRTAETDWARQETGDMRQALLSGREQALADLDAVQGRSPDPLTSAAAWAAHESLSSLLGEIEQGPTRRRDVPGPDAQRRIDAELLKIPLATGEQPTVDALLTAQDRTWEQAVALQQDQDVFGAAHRILDLAEQGSLPGEPVSFPPSRRAGLLETEDRRRRELLARHTDLVAELRRAQADGALTDDQDLSLQELLADAQPHTEEGGSRELILVRRTLERVAELLPRYRNEAAQRLRSRLDALPEIGDEDRAQVLRHLEADGLATAADLVYFLELGEPVPEIVSGESHLASFFPAVPDGLGQGITAELVRSVRTRGRHPELPALDYTRLSADEAERAAKALETWRAIGTTPPAGRRNAEREMLLPLNLLGYEAKQAIALDKLPRTVEYRFADVLDTEINGRAWAPAFGSKILEQAGRLRILMIWGRPSAQLLLSRVAQEPSKESLLVAYFGTLDSKARAELAAASVDIAPLIVVDDAALAYLAAQGNRQVSVATATLLPFSGVNPYLREKRGRIDREMFYGRDAERKRILDPDGTQIIFGGRGLGKSALLNDAGDRFAEQQPEHHQKLYLNLDQHNIGKGTALSAETIWSVLERELTDQQVLEKGRRKELAEAETDRYERVRSGIKKWLDAEPRRRLLILMDECDRFFEADVPHCTETRRLRGLCTETPGRMKVVFAGLHSVQRFTRLARNGPFSHLAQTPTVVGPLAPQFAADLLVDPMRALGFDFVDVDVVNRVLGYCSYQPFLLQMFGSRLVEVMQQRRRNRGDAAGPPYAITVTEVEAVESDPSLRADITAAFKDTLTLDDRYDVIANVLAFHARDNGLETRLSDAELRDECASWWRAGFSGLDSEGFRAYLQEMVGLGILAPNHDGRGWHLRGPNALRMIGTAQEVEHRLLTAASECELEETIVLEGRPELPDRRTAPLTVTQVDDLLAARVNQTRVVFGTPATGIGDVEGTLRSVTDRVGYWELPLIGGPSAFRQALTDGRPGARRVIVSDLAKKLTRVDTCRESLALARKLLPERADVTRAVVLVLGLYQLPLWRELLTDPEGSDSIAVFLQRHDQRSLRAWAQHTDLFTAERVTRLLELTGGWPLLLDRAISLQSSSGNEDEALNLLRDELRQKAFAAEFVDNSGLTADPLVSRGYHALSEEFGTEWTDEGYALTAVELAGLDAPDAEWVLTCLEALQAVDRDGDRLRLEPVLETCWSRR